MTEQSQQHPDTRPGQQARRHEGVPELPRTQVRALSRTRELADLFGRRPDLAGVYSPADLTAEAVRWSA